MDHPKRHHTTPCLILRNFADKEENFFVFDKRRSKNGVMADSIYNRFVRKHQNSLKLPDGTRDYSLEYFFTDIETAAAPIVNKIINSVRAKKVPKLTPSEKKIWDEFLLAQWTRVPVHRENLCPMPEFKVMTREILDKYEQHHGRPLTLEERNSMMAPEKLQELREGAMFDALQKKKPLAEHYLSEKGLGIAVIYDRRKSFVVGENTVLKMTPPHTNHLSDPTVEAWFPISHDVIVTPWGSRGDEKVVMMEDHQARQFNEVVFRTSNLVASKSRLLLESLSRNCGSEAA